MSRDLKALPALPLLVRESAVRTGAIPTEKGARVDGRGLDEFRPLHLQAGTISSAAGSAYIELGDTKVLCSVFAPHQHEAKEFLQHGQLDCSLRFTNFARATLRRGAPGGTLEERELSAALSSALSASVQLDRYPKSTVTVNALVVEDDGSALAAAISCASLALADASILLYDMVAACSSSFLSNSCLALDSCADEVKSGLGTLVVAQMPSLGQLTYVRHDGCTPFSQCISAMQQALAGSSKLHREMQRVLLASRKSLTPMRCNLEVPASPSDPNAIPKATHVAGRSMLLGDSGN